MTDLLTSAQMRAIEQATMADGGVTGGDLMRRAGAEVARHVLAGWSGHGRAVVLCGPGNNGGDGYVVAAVLKAAGWDVSVWALADSTTTDARAARAEWSGPVRLLMALDRAALAERPVVVDAVFGTGLRRPVPRAVSGALVLAQECGCPLVAIDILSGLCADSGRIRADGDFPDRPADLTVTFDSPRPGHMLDVGGVLTGPLQVADIGTGPARAELVAAQRTKVVSLARPRAGLHKGGGHKFDHGHLLVLAGGPGQGGAARLAARAGLRIGAGLVTLACPPAALMENAARLDAVMLRPLADASGLERMLKDTRIGALCLGPGMGTGQRQARLVAAALRSRRPCVVDADALTLLAQEAELVTALHEGCVLTPHGGEFARLFPDLAARLAAPPDVGAPAFSRLDAVRAAAARSGAVVLLKGADTVIAAPSGRCVVHAAFRERSAPWLATAGSGDVLAGLVAGLLARGLAPLDAAETAAWLHVEAALRVGPGLIAEDLPEALPAVLRALA